MPNAQPNPKGSVQRKPPSVLVTMKPSGGNGLPKYVWRSVPNPGVNSAVGKSIPNTSVNKALGNQSPNHSVNSGVNSSQDKKVQNNAMNTNQEQKENEIPIVNSVPSSYNVPKLELRKEIKEKLI